MKPKQTPAPEVKPRDKIVVRIPPELAERWAFAIANSTGDEPMVVRKLAEAFCDYWEENRSIQFPLAVVPRKSSFVPPQLNPADILAEEARIRKASQQGRRE